MCAFFQKNEDELYLYKFIQPTVKHRAYILPDSTLTKLGSSDVQGSRISTNDEKITPFLLKPISLK